MVVCMSIALVVAGAMIFAGTVQLRSMRTEFTAMDKMMSILKRQMVALQEEKLALEHKLEERDKEVELSVEMLGERNLKLKEMERSLQDKDVELQEKEKAVEAKQAQVEMNKNAAKKLALVLAQTQADKERLKTETAALIKPEIDKCNEAMAAKDAAIAALVAERDRADSDIAKSEREAEQANQRLEGVQRELDRKSMEVEQLKSWKSEASKQFKDHAERSKSIWAASVAHREGGGGSAAGAGSRLVAPIAFPPSAISGAKGLGAHLQKLSRATGAELGVADPMTMTSPLLSEWGFAKSYVLMDIGPPNSHEVGLDEMKQTLHTLDRRIRYLQVPSVDEAIRQLEDDSLDFIHIGAVLHNEEDNVRVLEACWPKLREGGALAGGFQSPTEAMPTAVRGAVLSFAEGKERQPITGLTEATRGLWLLRK